MKILVVGNCQSETLRQLIDLNCPGAQVERVDVAKVKPGAIAYRNFDHVLLQDHPRLAPEMARARTHPHVLVFPNISFNGYHPDMLGLRRPGSDQPALRVSSIALWSFHTGLAIDECLALYSQAFVDHLNYRDIFRIARREFIKNLDKCGLQGEFLFAKWHRDGPFMMNVGHPRLFVMVDLARHLLARMGRSMMAVDAEMLVVNQGRRGDIFPTFNEPATGTNHLLSRDARYVINLRAFDTPEFVQRCYRTLAKGMEGLELPMARLEIFKKAYAAYTEQRAHAAPARVNPYSSLPPSSFWRSMVGVPGEQVTPVVERRPLITPASRVATAGSCFAQHISRTLKSHGLNYFVAEQAPAQMPPEQAEARHYGVFSARYGNLYTARQLLQLARAAFGHWAPVETSWMNRAGKYIDPYRPNVGDEFDDESSLVQARAEHLEAVRRLLRDTDVLVFTLGLTESWTHVRDGAVFPVAPGVVSVHSQYADYRFVNFTEREVVDDMVEFLGLLAAENPRAKVVLTVSPVPLVATYEPEHALVATTHSKAVLRAAAATLAKRFEQVSYFPSYEIITGPQARGRYYDEDLRSIRPEGVAHVMRVFMESMVRTAAAPAPTPQATAEREDSAGVLAEIEGNSGLVCDEELIVSRR